jgi:hypothetical protein
MIMLKSKPERGGISMRHAYYPLIIASLLLAAVSVMCSIFVPADSGKVNAGDKQATVASLQKTVIVMEKVAVTATIEPTKEIPFPTMVKPPAGSIAGLLSYPSETIPAMRVVAINVDSGEYFSTEVFDQGTYRLDELPVGKYHVVAYLVHPIGENQSLAGGYTQFVLCGRSVNCTDHTLVDVEVAAMSNTPEVNPADWYAPDGTFPADPTQ